MPVDIRSIKFWINAFIPKDIPGYTRPVPGSVITMIPGPVLVPGSYCYHTDQRGFSYEIHANSRMHSEARLEPRPFGAPPSMTQWHKCDTTTECNCKDGRVTCSKKGLTSRMKFVLVPARIGSPTGLAEIKVSCAANNPCSRSSRLFGDIDYSGLITISFVARSIEFDLKIDAFPAFEAYAAINDGAGAKVFQIPPPRGNTVMNLPGDANREVHCRLEDCNGDGVFEKLIPVKMPSEAL
jgi:hypothetical protein